jgi:branched-chain amino acid transport system permease protein
MSDVIGPLLQLLINGVVLGGITMLLACAVSLVFGLTRIVFFAEGTVLVLAALVTWDVYIRGWPFGVALAGALLVVSCLLFLIERFMFSLVVAQPIKGFIVSLALVIILDNVMVKIWSGQPKYIPAIFPGTWQIGTVRLVQENMVALAVSYAVGLGVVMFLRRTLYGKAIRAYAEDGQMAELLGIPVRPLVAATFVAAGCLAVVGGSFWITLYPITPYSDSAMIILAFAAAIIGGLGSVEGAVVAALVLGVVQSLGAYYISPQWTSGFAFVAIMLMLILRPAGLFKGVQGAALR